MNEETRKVKPYPAVPQDIEPVPETWQVNGGWLFSGAVLTAGGEGASGDRLRGEEGAPHLLQDQDGQGQVARQAQTGNKRFFSPKKLTPRYVRPTPGTKQAKTHSLMCFSYVQGNFATENTEISQIGVFSQFQIKNVIARLVIHVFMCFFW